MKGAPDIEQIVERLRARVEERRRSNQYPPDLEEELSEHFRRIVSRGALKDHPPLGNVLAPVRASKAFDAGLIHSDSEKPAGRFFHQAVAKLVSRQTQGILEQVSRFAEAVDRALTALAERIEEPTHIRNELASRIDAALERLAAYERAPIDTPQGFLEISRRVEGLEAFVRSQHVRPWYGLTRLEEALDESQKDYGERYSPWAAELEAHPPVLDIGCGTGSFLNLLLERGVQAEGVESDPMGLEAAVGKGLSVIDADPLKYLASRIDEELGGASVIRSLERMTAQQAIELVALLGSKVKEGGLVIVETLNPRSLGSGTHDYFRNPSHRNMFDPDLLSFLFKEAGFSRAEPSWEGPSGEAQRYTLFAVR